MTYASAELFLNGTKVVLIVMLIARLVIGLITSEEKGSLATVCVGIGFVLGHYSVSGDPSEPETGVAIIRLAGAVTGLLIAIAGSRLRLWWKNNRAD